jgi:hypothetical protein
LRAPVTDHQVSAAHLSRQLIARIRSDPFLPMTLRQT